MQLELLITGEVQLLDADGNTSWTSDGDNDFWEFIGTDFVEEGDIDEILAYLDDNGKLTPEELDSFENGTFDIIVEEPEEGLTESADDAEDSDEDD